MHVHVSDNRETMSEAENSWLPVDVDNREKSVRYFNVTINYAVCDNRENVCDAFAFSRER